MIDVTSRQLRGFLLVAEHRSFTRAAEAMAITPSGLSVLVRELESQIRFRLFDRTTRSVSLTHAGTEFLAVARKSLDELDAATSRIGRIARASSHAVSVGAGLLMAANVLPHAIREFHAQRPDVRVRLFDAGPDRILHEVRRGNLDVGLGFFEPTSGIRCLPFFRFSLMVIRPEAAIAPLRASVSWSALKDETLILQAEPAPIRPLIDRRLARAAFDARNVISVNRLETVIAMVEAGHGTGIVPSFALPVCRRRNVAMSRLVNPVVPIDLFEIHDRGRRLSAAAGSFTAFLQAYIARWAGRSGVPPAVD